MSETKMSEERARLLVPFTKLVTPAYPGPTPSYDGSTDLDDGGFRNPTINTLNSLGSDDKRDLYDAIVSSKNPEPKSTTNLALGKNKYEEDSFKNDASRARWKVVFVYAGICFSFLSAVFSAPYALNNDENTEDDQRPHQRPSMIASCALSFIAFLSSLIGQAKQHFISDEECEHNAIKEIQAHVERIGLWATDYTRGNTAKNDPSTVLLDLKKVYRDSNKNVQHKFLRSFIGDMTTDIKNTKEKARSLDN